MEEKKVDRRVKYTRGVLRESLLSLMQERSVDKITVKEICEKADVNRGTFYSHYKDQYDLLRHIEDELTEEIMSSVQSQLEDGDLTEMLVRIFRTIENNRELCGVLFSEYGDKDFIKKLLDIAKEGSVKSWKQKMPEVPEYALELMYEFCAHGSVAIIQYWLSTGIKADPEKITEFIEKISVNGLDVLYKLWMEE